MNNVMVGRNMIDTENYVELCDLVLTDRLFAHNVDEKAVSLPRIGLSDLNNNIRLDDRSIKNDKVKKNDLVLNDSCFLLGVFKGQLNFSYFKYEDEMYTCSANIIPIKIDEQKVSILYFAKQLTEVYLQKQIKGLIKDTVIQKVSKSDLLKVKIALLSASEQQDREKEYRKFFHEADRNLQLMASLEDQLYEQTLYLRHSIAGPARNILSFIKKMMTMIDNNPNIMVREIGGTKLKPTDRYSFNDMREIIERDLLKVVDIVKNQLDVQEQILRSKLELMDIDAFLSEYTHILEQANPDIIIIYESFVPHLLDEINKTSYVTILGNKDLLRTMLDNLFENARQHAFQERSGEKFLINLNYDEDYGVLSIEVANSGKGFPKDIDFEGFIRKNKKSNERFGNGFGGWYIDQVIKHHKGSFEMFDNSIFKQEISEGYATSFYIELPLVIEEIHDEL